MKKVIISVLFLSSILSCSGAEEGHKLKEEKGISTSLSDRKFVVTPLAAPNTVPGTSAIPLSAKMKADRCISNEYKMSRSMFPSDSKGRFDDQQRLTAEALADLREKSKAKLKGKVTTSHTSIEPCTQNIPLEIVKDGEPE